MRAAGDLAAKHSALLDSQRKQEDALRAQLDAQQAEQQTQQQQHLDQLKQQQQQQNAAADGSGSQRAAVDGAGSQGAAAVGGQGIAGHPPAEQAQQNQQQSRSNALHQLEGAVQKAVVDGSAAQVLTLFIDLSHCLSTSGLDVHATVRFNRGSCHILLYWSGETIDPVQPTALLQSTGVPAALSLCVSTAPFDMHSWILR